VINVRRCRSRTEMRQSFRFALNLPPFNHCHSPQSCALLRGSTIAPFFLPPSHFWKCFLCLRTALLSPVRSREICPYVYKGHLSSDSSSRDPRCRIVVPPLLKSCDSVTRCETTDREVTNLAPSSYKKKCFCISCLSFFSLRFPLSP